MSAELPLDPSIIHATYDGSVFRPLGPVSLPPNTLVQITVPTASSSASPTSFLDVAAEQHLHGPKDWASNLKEYLYGEPPIDEQ